MLFEASEGSVTLNFQGTGVLTRYQTEKLKITPFEFPLHSLCRKTPTSEAQTSTSEILSSSPPQNP